MYILDYRYRFVAYNNQTNHLHSKTILVNAVPIWCIFSYCNLHLYNNRPLQSLSWKILKQVLHDHHTIITSNRFARYLAYTINKLRYRKYNAVTVLLRSCIRSFHITNISVNITAAFPTNYKLVRSKYYNMFNAHTWKQPHSIVYHIPNSWATSQNPGILMSWPRFEFFFFVPLPYHDTKLFVFRTEEMIF